MKNYLRKQNRQAILGVVEEVKSRNPEEPGQYKRKFKLASWTHKTKEKSVLAKREKLLPSTSDSLSESPSMDEDAVKSTLDHELWQPSTTASQIFFLGSGTLDPFDALSIKLGPLSQRLLVHC